MSVVMKPSGVQWIGDIPENWVKDKLYRLTDFVSSGGTPTSTNPDYYEDGDIVWIQTGDLNDGYVSETSKKITQYGLENSSAKTFDKGTLLMAMYGATIGKLGIMTVDAATNQACCAMKYDTKTNTKFMYYIFLAMRTHLINQSYGGGQPNISQEVVKQQYLCFPKYSEQEFIANFLDKATSQIDNAIKTKQTQLKTLEALKKSIIHKAVTKGLDDSVAMKDSGIEWIGEIPEHWNVEKIKQKYDVISSNVDKKSYDDEISVSLCNYTDVYYKDYITNDIEFMAATATDLECKKFQLNIDDVIITKDSEDPHDIAVPALVKEIANKLLCGYHLSMIRSINSNSSGSYLFWCLKDSSIASQLHREATGITRWAIAKKHIKNSLIPMPPIEEQNNICIFLEAETEKINTLKSNVKNQINKLKEYKKSLIYEYVTGKKLVKE